MSDASYYRTEEKRQYVWSGLLQAKDKDQDNGDSEAKWGVDEVRVAKRRGRVWAGRGGEETREEEER